jgi:pimeloyl-ACP methyl ester carboxylesterase
VSGLAVETHGHGEPLVLVHGLATTRVIWRRVVPALSRRRRVLTLDVPGFGGSEPVGRGFDLDAVAAAIASGVARAGAQRPFDLVGHSMGGALAIVLAARDPAAVRRLILVAPAGLRPMPPRVARLFGAGASTFIPLRRRAAGLADQRWGRRLLMTPGTADPGALPPAEVRAMLDASRGATRIAEALASAASADLRPLLRGLDVPVGALWGDRDRIIPPGGLDTVATQRPDAPIARIPGAGHIPMMETPAAFVAALESVFAALSPIEHIVDEAAD